MSQSTVKIYSAPPVDMRAVLRYALDTRLTPETEELYRSCMEECLPKTVYKLCYLETEVSVTDFGVRLGGTHIPSDDLRRRLEGCEIAVVFAATVGLDYDRLVTRYGRLDTARAHIINAIGTERVEALCDAFCADLADTHGGVTARFSAGYGDLPLELQRDIFAMLKPERIGIYLNGSLLMTPSKSVTAIVGIKQQGATEEL